MARIKNKAVRKLEEKLYKERKKSQETLALRHQFLHYSHCACESCKDWRHEKRKSCQIWVGKEAAIDFGDFWSGNHKTAYGTVLRYGSVKRAPSGQHALQIRMLVTKIIDSEGHVEEWWPGLIRHYYGTPKKI